MYEILTGEQPYYDIEMSAKDIIDVVGHRQLPLVSSKNQKVEFFDIWTADIMKFLIPKRSDVISEINSISVRT